MKRLTRELVSFACAFLIVFSTFGNAFFVAEASEQTSMVSTVSDTDVTAGGDVNGSVTAVPSTDDSVRSEGAEDGEDASGSDNKKEDVSDETTSDDTEADASDKDTTKTAEDESSDSTTPSASSESADERIQVTVTPEAGEVSVGTEVELSCDVEGAVIRYSIDGSKNFKKYNKGTKIVITEDMTIMAYATLDDASEDGTDPFVFTYTVDKSDDSKGSFLLSETEGTLTLGDKLTEVKNGSKVVIAVGDYVLTTEASGNTKLVSEKMTSDDAGVKTVSQSAAVFTVEMIDSYVAFKTEDGKYLASTATVEKPKSQGAKFVNSLASSNEDPAKWTLEKQNDGTFYVNNPLAKPTGNSVKPLFLACNKNNEYTLLVNSDANKNFIAVEFYSLGEASEITKPEVTLSAGEKIKDITKLAEDQEFVLVHGNDKAMTKVADGKKLKATDVKLNEENLLTYSDEEAEIAKLKLVKAETEDQYYITADFEVTDAETAASSVETKYLTTAEKGGQLSFEKEKNDYSLWTVELQEDGEFLLKSVNAQYTQDDKTLPVYVEFYGDCFKIFSYEDGVSKKADYTFAAYTMPEYVEPEEPENTVAKLLTRELYNGDKVVVYYPDSKKIMTSEATGSKLKDADVTVAESEETGKTIDISNTKACVLTVSEEDGNYVLKSSDGKYLTATLTKTTGSDGKEKTNAGLVLADERSDYSLWKQEAADDTNAGNFYLENVNAKNGSYAEALEYYSGFTTYGIKKGEKAFVFNFFALSEGKSLGKKEYYDVDMTVAQWAGNADYSEHNECANYISGDLYATNDMLDKSAKFTVHGTNAKDKDLTTPWKKTTSSTTKSTNYYMGGTGVRFPETDYMQFELSSLGYGKMNMSFRLRASEKAAGSFQLKYSTDGEEFKNFTKGTYSFKYTQHYQVTNADGQKELKQSEKSGSGEISDGIAQTSLASENYVSFTFEVPSGADDAEKLYIRLVPGTQNAGKNGEPSAGGFVRVDSVVISGKPVKDENRTSPVTVKPEAGDVMIGQQIELSTETEGADIYYALAGGEFVKYDAEQKVVLQELPVTVSAYARKDGLSQSITGHYLFTQAQVASVTATPNGGNIVPGTKITLTTKTENAKILYRYRTAEEIAADDKASASSSSSTSTEPSDEESEDENTNEQGSEDHENEKPSVEYNDWIEYTEPITLSELPCQLQVKATKEGCKESAVSTLKYGKRLNEKYNIYFGQIHAHTNISDGDGTITEAYEHAKKVDNLDYIVITDHSNSLDNEKESKITANVDKSESDEWTMAHNVARQLSTPDFTCAYGYEMTWSNNLGHMNTYNTPGFQSRTQTEYATYSTALNNYYAALRSVPDSVSQFNHPGPTFGDFQDFSYYTEENDRLITMIEVGNGEGQIGSSGYFPSYEYYTRALDKGWHVAPTNNQDNHKGRWGDANTARTVMLADENNEELMYDAMRNYRIYATEDNDLSIYYTLDGNIMGSILTQDQVGEQVEIKAEIKDPTDSQIGKVEVIVNGGQSIESKNVTTNAETVTFTVPSSYSYYYLRITEADGDIAVTAPVWVGELDSCGINKTYTNTVLPVKGQEIDINVDLYNNEKSALEINNIKIELTSGNKEPVEVVNLTGEQAGIASVAPNGTATYSTKYVYEDAGKVYYNITVEATLNGVSKVYTDKLAQDYVVPEMVTDVIIDGSHANDYVNGYYGGNAEQFISICGKKNIRAQIVTDELTADALKKCSLLVLSAPARKDDKNGTYKAAHYSDAFIAAVKEYVANGGSVIVCGLADYQDAETGQTATEQNKILEAIGSTIRVNSDEAWDDENNGNSQQYRLYLNTFNSDAPLMKGVKAEQKYSQYSGCTVDVTNATANDYVEAAQWLVKGHETTYSVNTRDDNGKKLSANEPLDNKGNAVMIASQKTKAGGTIVVAGGVFFSNFEVKAEIDNNSSLPYANYTILNNILDDVTVELPTSTIAQARAGKNNDVFAVEGYVTSGTEDKNTTFFDTIYIQDETAGIDIFPYSETGLKIGTKMRIVGYVDEYQGDKELKIISYKILDDEPHVYEPKEVDTKTAMDYDNYGGSLLKTTGKVTRVSKNSAGKVSEFWIADEQTGSEAAIFIDGYIYSKETGENNLDKFVKVGAVVSAAGVLYLHPEGDSEKSVPVFRVRNCDEIVLVTASTEPDTPDPSGESSTGASEASSEASSSGTGASEASTEASSSGTGASEASTEASSTETGEAASKPYADVKSGAVRKGTIVNLDTATAGAVIYYTTDGSDPTEESFLYEDAFTINEATTIKAVSYKSGLKISDPETFTYTIRTDWGDVERMPSGLESAIKGWFTDDSEVPGGVWYAFGDETNGYSYLTQPGDTNITMNYTGSAITISDKIFVFHNTRALIENRDYTLVYATNIAANAAQTKVPTVTVRGKGTYSSAAAFTFTIDADAISNADITSEKVVTVLANKGTKLGATKPVVSYKGKNLVINKDYVLNYYEGEAADDSKLVANPANRVFTEQEVLEGKTFCIEVVAKAGSNFTGSHKQLVKIVPIANAKDLVQVSKLTVTDKNNKPIALNYNDETAVDIAAMFEKGDAVVKNGKTTLVYGVDYTVVPGTSDHKSAGKHSFAIVGLSKEAEARKNGQIEYIGEKTCTYEIKGTALNRVKFAGLLAAVNYKADGSSITLADLFNANDKVCRDNNWDAVTLYEYVAATKTNVPLTLGTDYDVVMSNTGVVGRFTAEFVGKNGYTGSVKKIVTVKASSFKEAGDNLVISVDDATYLKSGAKPHVSVTLYGQTLRQGIDYTVTYKNNIKVFDTTGKTAKELVQAPSVTVTGIGNFTGASTSKTFSISKANVTQIKMVTADVTYNAKGRAGYFLVTPKLMDDGKAIVAGKDRDVEAIKKTDYAYTYYADTVLMDGTERAAGSTVVATDKVPVGTTIVVSVPVSCSEKSPYVANASELRGYYRVIGAGKDISKATVTVRDKNKLTVNNGEEIKLTKADLVVNVGTAKAPVILGNGDYRIVSLTNTKGVGTAVLVIEGTGEYGGTKTVNLKITAKGLQ